MPPVSSLIFVVILAVWAVYLVQHWVRRRDHLATARSVDRFSEAMRVLERRRALPRPDVKEQVVASSAPLLRPARPEVVVKRGTPAAAHGSTAVAPSASYRRSKAVARLRATALLVSSVVMFALAALVAAQLIHWAWAFVGVALLALTVGGIRVSLATPRSSSRGRPRAAQRPLVGAQRQQAPALAAQAAAVAMPRTARREVDLPAQHPAPVPYDLHEVEAGLAADQQTRLQDETAADSASADTTSAEPASTELVPAGSWDPVPVPPPTYTLKARAYRGSAELPADGAQMALEEEFEELPQVHRVG